MDEHVTGSGLGLDVVSPTTVGRSLGKHRVEIMGPCATPCVDAAPRPSHHPSRASTRSTPQRPAGMRRGAHPCHAVTVTQRLDGDGQPQFLGHLAFVAERAVNTAPTTNAGAK